MKENVLKNSLCMSCPKSKKMQPVIGPQVPKIYNSNFHTFQASHAAFNPTNMLPKEKTMEAVLIGCSAPPPL